MELIIKAENVMKSIIVDITLQSQTAQGMSIEQKVSLLCSYFIEHFLFTAGSDFLATTHMIVLSPGQREETVRVLIIDDSTAEETEVFTAILTTGDMDTPAMATVTILDNDSKGKIICNTTIIARFSLQ